MQLEKKHILWIVGGVVLLAAVGIGIYLITRPGDEEKANEKGDEGHNNPAGSNPKVTEPAAKPAPTGSNTYPVGRIAPVYNEEGELKNEISDLKNVLLYPKRQSAGGWGYANVRSSAEVNNDTGWFFDGVDNLITTINSGTPIGRVIEETAGVYNNYSYRWFKVKLTKPVGFWGTEIGYVRGDTVTFIPYDK